MTDLRDAPSWYLDPFAAWHKTPADIEAATKERARRIREAANDPSRPRKPLTHAELEADGDTRDRGKSRGARLRERRPAPLRIYTDGGDNHGYWHGTPGVDFDV